jgi:hypothetical protein
MVTHADGYAERDAALLMLHEQQKHRSRRITVGARTGRAGKWVSSYVKSQGIVSGLAGRWCNGKEICHTVRLTRTEFATVALSETD